MATLRKLALYIFLFYLWVVIIGAALSMVMVSDWIIKPFAHGSSLTLDTLGYLFFFIVFAVTFISAYRAIFRRKRVYVYVLYITGFFGLLLNQTSPSAPPFMQSYILFVLVLTVLLLLNRREFS